MLFYKEVVSLGKEHTEIPNDWDRSGLPSGAFLTTKCLKLKKICFLDAIGSLSVIATIYRT